MGKVRIVLANMPQILCQIMRDLLDRQPDMTVVGEVGTLDEVPRAVDSLGAEAVILTLPSPTSGRAVYLALRGEQPHLTVLGLAPEDDRAVVWSPHTSPRPVELSAAGILEALREHAPRPRS